MTLKSKVLYVAIALFIILEVTILSILLIRTFHDVAHKIPLLGVTGLIAISSFIVILKVWFFNRKIFFFDNKDLTIFVLLAFFINYNLYGLIPFNVSRSNSIIMMGYLKQSQGISRTKSEIQAFVQKKYFSEYDAIQKRLNEQVAAGNVKKTRYGYEITERGLLIMDIFGQVSNFYKLDNDFTNLTKEEAVYDIRKN